MRMYVGEQLLIINIFDIWSAYNSNRASAYTNERRQDIAYNLYAWQAWINDLQNINNTQVNDPTSMA